MRTTFAFFACLAVGAAAFALVPFVHPMVHEGEAFGATLSGLLLAGLTARLWRSRAQAQERNTRMRRERRLRELSA